MSDANPYDSVMGSAPPVPQSINPDDAAKAIKVAPKVGVPAQSLMGNPKPANELAESNTARTISNTNPAMARWASGDPAKVAASQDDFPHLDALSKGLQAFSDIVGHTENIIGAALVRVDPETGKWLPPADASVGEAAVKGFTEYGPESKKQVEAAASDIPHILDEPTTDVGKAFSTLANNILPGLPIGIRATTDVAGLIAPMFLDLLDPLTRPIEHLTGVRREAINTVISSLIPFSKAEVPATIERNIFMRPRLPAPEGQVIEGEFKEVPSEQEHAQQNVDLLTTLKGAVDESKTQARSPETMEDFIGQHTTGSPIESVSIPAEKAVELYIKRGIVPHPGDGVLGDVPNFTSNLMKALASGGDVDVPTAHYLAHVPEDVHNELKNFISIGGTPSLEDAKAGVPNGTSTINWEEAHPQGLTEEETERLAEAMPAMRSAVERVKNQLYLQSVFASAKDVDLTTPQFAAYAKAIGNADASTTQTMYNLVKRQVERERGAEWQAKSAAVRPEIEKFFQNRPDWQARHFLTTGEFPDGTKPLGAVKLDRADTIARYGKSVEGLPAELFGKDGVGADDIADAFRFTSGEDMLRKIGDLENQRKLLSEKLGKEVSIPDHLKEFVNSAVQSRVRGELGDLLSPESIAAAASEAVRSPQALDLLHKEIQGLADLAGIPYRKGDIAWVAKERFRDEAVAKALKIKPYERIVTRLGSQAEKALLGGDAKLAFQKKQLQLLAVHMLNEAHAFVREYRVISNKIGRWIDNPVPTTIAQPYMNRITELLSRMGYPTKVPDALLAKELIPDTFESWADQHRALGEAIGDTPILAKRLLGDMTVGEVRSTNEVLTSIATSGRNAQMLISHGKRMSLEDAVNRIHDQFDDLDSKFNLPQLVTESQTAIQRAGAALRTMGSWVKGVEFLLDRFDGARGIHGVMNETVMRPMQDAWDDRSTELQKFAKHVGTFLDSIDSKYVKSFEDKIEVDLPFRDVHGEEVRPIAFKKNLLMAALHYGNISGRTKLLQGFGWGDKEEQVLLAAFDKYLTPQDLDWLRTMWAWGDKSYERIEPFTRRMAGLPVEDVGKADFQVGKALLRGGYAPIVYNPQLTPFAPGGSIKMSKSDLFQAHYGSVATPRGYTVLRSPYVGPIHLDPSFMYSAYMQAIHDYTMREAIMSANRIITDKRSEAWLRKAVGNEYYQMLPDWLRRVANTTNTNIAELRGLSAAGNMLLHSMINANLAYRVGTVVIHGTTAGAKSLQDLGRQGLATSLKLYMDDREAFVKFANDSSEFIRDRRIDRDDNFRDRFVQMTKAQGKISEWNRMAQDLGFELLRMSDNISAYVQWRGAYEEAMMNPDIGEHAYAVYYADKAVRKAHGSGRDLDLPLLLAPKSIFLRSFTPFMTSRLNSLNRIMASKDWKKLIVNMLTTVGVSGVVYSALHPDSRRPWWRNLMDNTVAEGLGYIPILGSLVYAVQHDSKVQASLFDDAGQAFASTINDTLKEIQGKRAPIVNDYLRLLGVGTGGVTGALARPAQYWWDLATGYQPYKGIGPTIRGTLMGPPPRGN